MHHLLQEILRSRLFYLLAWLGALMLSVFTLSAIPLAHRFWEMQGLEAFLEQVLVQDHISVIGGLLVAAALAQVHRQSRS